MDKLQFTNLLQIKEASQHGRLVLFVGAGVSNNSGVPTWSDLIRQMKDGCGADDETDDLKIAQLYKDSRGEKEYMNKVKEVLKYNSIIPNPIHKSILDLRPVHIITTNYDNLLEQEIQNEFKQFAIIKEDRDMPNMTYPNSLIKMHGDFDTNNIVLTESDYHNYQRNFPLIRSFVLSLFASKLVCFVGFSFADLNLKMILNDLRSVLHDSMQRVYLISDSKPSQVISRYYENKGINVVYLDTSDLEELLPKGHEDERATLTNPKGIYLHKVLDCIKEARRGREQDLSSQLYSQLKEIKDEISVIGDGLRYFIPKKERPMFNPHSEGLQLMSLYFKELHKQLKTFSGRKQFIQDHPNIDWRELKQIAYNNYLYSIDDVEIVDPQKQYELNVSLGDFSALWHLYNFDFDKLIKRITHLSARDLTCDYQDLEYPFVLYKLGNYYDAYHEYNKILPLAWQRGKYILYFICLYNLWSIRNGVYVALMMENEKLANKIHEKLSGIALDEVLGRLPVSEEIRRTFQDLLSFRSLGNSAVESEERRELIYHQRKSGERGGSSINSNIVSLLSKYDRTFQFCNNNYIVCDNNDFYKSIAYNAVCGMLNSYATPKTKFEGLDLETSKIGKLFSFCLFTLIFGIESKKLQEIFRRYEIKQIEITDEAIVTLNNYWENLINAKRMPFVDRGKFENYIENLMYVTSKICTKGINGDNVYKTILKYWDMLVCFKIDGKLLAYLLSSLQPNKEILITILDKLTSNLETYKRFDDCYEWIAHYLSKQESTYDFDLSKLTEGKYAKELHHLYKIIEPSKQKEFSSYCQENLHQIRDYLEFIVDNHIDVLSTDEFSKKLESIENKPNYYKTDCYWLLSKMRHNEKYSCVHETIDEITTDNECMKFFLAPIEYNKKENVDVEWILTTGGEGVPELAKIPKYKEKLKQYLVDNKYLSAKTRNNIVSVL